LKKAKKKRKDETEEDSDSSDRSRIFSPYTRRAMRKYRMPNTSRQGGSGGGRSPPGAYFIHHDIRYAPEPPAYKTPKPEYPSYTRRELERPLIHERYIAERSNDEATLERILRNLVKDLPENHEPEAHEFSESIDNANKLPEIINRDPENSAKMLEKYLAKTEPIIEVEKEKQEQNEAEFDPERLLKGLEASPTEYLHEKTLAQLNSEPEFDEEEIEGSEVETNRLSDQTNEVTSEQAELEHSKADTVEHAPQPIENVNSELVAEPLPPVELSAFELEVLADVQDLMKELEPEIEEREEIEPSA
jgi:hypothetical protein